MFYIAKCYVGHAGTMLRPGEAFEADSHDAKIEWLLSQEAIVPATPAFATDEDNDQQDDAAKDAQENHRMQMENLGYDAAGNSLDDEEPDADEEPIEIDGLDGIVSAEPQEESPANASPAKKGRKKA